MHRSIFLYLCLLSYLFGVLVWGVVLNCERELALVLVTSFLVSLLLLSRIFKEELRFIVCVLGVFCLGCFHLDYAFVPDGEVKNFLGEQTFVAIIVSEVDKRDKQVKYTVESDQIGPGKILVNAQRYPVYSYGDKVEISGRVELPEMAPEFDYRAYLSRYGVYYIVYFADLSLVEKGELSSVLAWIYELKSLFEEQINLVFSEPHGSFMAGLLIGSRRGLPRELMEKFNLTGLTHIIAISGYNITLLIVFISLVFSFVRRSVRVYLGYVLIVLFVIFTGLSASVVRAGIMGVIGLMAIQQGRQYLALLSLVLSAAVMVLINPKVLMADSGFQLSIMATLGIVVFGERIKNRFEKFGTMIADTISMTLSAQIFNLPIMMLSFGRVATVSLFANLLVLPLLPIAMLFGFVAVVVSFINLGLGRIVGFVAYIVLECVLKIVDVMAELSFLNLEKTVTGEIMVVYYLCFWGYLLFWIRARREKFARSYL